MIKCSNKNQMPPRKKKKKNTCIVLLGTKWPESKPKQYYLLKEPTKVLSDTHLYKGKAQFMRPFTKSGDRAWTPGAVRTPWAAPATHVHASSTRSVQCRCDHSEGPHYPEAGSQSGCYDGGRHGCACYTHCFLKKILKKRTSILPPAAG